MSIGKINILKHLFSKAAKPTAKTGIRKAGVAPITAGELVMGALPDFGFEVANQFMMGDGATLGDRGASIIGNALIPAGAGIGAGRLYRRIPGIGGNQMGQFVADTAGSLGGGYGGVHVTNALQGALDPSGLDYYSRMSEAQRLAHEEEIKRQTLAAAGVIPSYPLNQLG